MNKKLDCFANYERRKGLWFWMMLSIASVVSDNPEISARNSDEIVNDFIKSEFYQSIFLEDLSERLFLKHHG